MDDPFGPLLDALESPRMALAAPVVYDGQGQREDSWRKFPSPLGLAFKLFRLRDGTYLEASGALTFEPDWVAGMFLLFILSAAGLGILFYNFPLLQTTMKICSFFIYFIYP